MTITTNKTHIKNKTLRVKKATITPIYYIQTMKKLPCVISSVNITFINTKRDKCP